MRVAALVAAAILVAACSDDRGKAEAEQAVRTYIARVIDAYRTSDASLVDPLVNDQQGMKLLGLIGVKRDAGVVLDARLLEIAFTRVERDKEQWVVETKERWYYKDRKIGSGVQAGEDSTDAYAMRYRFSRKEGRLILEDLEFIGAPQVGRKVAPLPVDSRVLHGLPPLEEGAGPESGRPRGDGGPRQGMPAGHPSVDGSARPPGHPPVERGSAGNQEKKP